MTTTEAPLSAGSLSMIAKLLATENILIEHRRVRTASFTLETRLLVLPVWHDMNRSLYSMLVGHEVGHALYTPIDYTTQADKVATRHRINTATFHTYLNIIEDARIERKMKIRYPGLRKDFYTAYRELFEKNFFGVKGIDPGDLSFINRVNLRCKVGSFCRIPFKNEIERKLIARIETSETFEAVCALAEEAYLYSKDLESRVQAESDYDSDDSEEDFENEDGEDNQASTGSEDFTPDDELPESKPRKLTEDEIEDALLEREKQNEDAAPASTQAEFQKMMESTLVDASGVDPIYVRWPSQLNPNNFIIGYEELLAHGDLHITSVVRDDGHAKFQKFRKDNRAAISYLVQEFEAKKAAMRYARSKDAKTGSIAPTKLHSYRFADDIFKRITLVPDGKSHGVVMLVDMSSSMADNMQGTIEQVLNLVMFCRGVSIPHRVYGFSSVKPGHCEADINKFFDQHRAQLHSRDAHGPAELEIAFNDRFWLLEMFHERMRQSAFTRMASMLLGQYVCPNLTSVPLLELHNTPLNEAIVVSRFLIESFKKDTRSDIVNTIFLTDGESNSDAWHRAGERVGSIRNSRGAPLILIDPISRCEGRVLNTNSSYTYQLMIMLRKICRVQVQGFYISIGSRQIHYHCTSANRDSLIQSYRDKKWTIIEGAMGCDRVYFIEGGRHLQVRIHSLNGLDADSSPSAIRNAFIKMTGSKRTSRVLLSRFIDSII
jgi:hypothetical protein